MPRLIIAIQKKVSLHGHNVRGFRFDATHALHIWEGRELELEEFNKISRKVFQENAGLYPFALVVGAGEEAVGPKAAAELEELRGKVAALETERTTLVADGARLREGNDAQATEIGRLCGELTALQAALNPPAVVLAPAPEVKPKGRKGGKA